MAAPSGYTTPTIPGMDDLAGRKAWFETGEGALDFLPSQHIHYSKSDLDYTLDTTQIFNNLYAEDE